MEGTVTISLTDYEVMKLKMESDQYFISKTYEMIMDLSTKLDLAAVDSFYTKNDIEIKRLVSLNTSYGYQCLGKGKKKYTAYNV